MGSRVCIFNHAISIGREYQSVMMALVDKERVQCVVSNDFWKQALAEGEKSVKNFGHSALAGLESIALQLSVAASLSSYCSSSTWLCK